MSLARQLRRDNDGLFEAARSHPFVKGIGDGSLPREVFGRWIVQDWLYLEGYVKALEAASALAPDESARSFWGDLARLTVEEELDLHRGLAQRFGLSPERLHLASPYDATTRYLSTLSAASQHYPSLVATLTPCAVGYAEIARSLQAQGTCSEPDYVAWIETYIDPVFQETVGVFEDELDRCGEGEKTLVAIKKAYRSAARCELAFWEGLWRG